MLSKTKLFGALTMPMRAKAMDVGPYTHEAGGKIDPELIPSRVDVYYTVARYPLGYIA